MNVSLEVGAIGQALVLPIFTNTVLVANDFDRVAYSVDDTLFLQLEVSGVGKDVYDLKSSFRPVTDPAPTWAGLFNTDLGEVEFTEMLDVSFEAVAIEAAEPMTLVLACLGLAGLAVSRRSRKY